MTTRSAVLTSSIRSLVRPARSLSQPCIEKPRPGGAPANAEAVKKLALFQRRSARCLTSASLVGSSAMTLKCRGLELGASIRNRASAAVDILALSLSIVVFLRSVYGVAPSFLLPSPLWGGVGGGGRGVEQGRAPRHDPPPRPSPSQNRVYS